jgi:hypothetical protein
LKYLEVVACQWQNTRLLKEMENYPGALCIDIEGAKSHYSKSNSKVLRLWNSNGTGTSKQLNLGAAVLEKKSGFEAALKTSAL